ncbi:MAG: ABC transporter ATP-binding protein [Anaeromicrobium sp.]|jgi:iron complex transport system ATP-binding protein|uniref:ABC transporter ATP-binding protein n=1 Tax=Anaeromicrobium sp. TaxID=1929132 RepID=UPI0025EFF823|nr:ABC transporter ATP-binding protein [Anaeromicrobium sp.]MCT4593851.1 ABC transporter ATP-binding protein [Anaeromicrobium sp.]
MIRIEHLSYTIGNKHILNNINCHIEKGLIYGVIGPNGSGKTTLLKHLYKEIPSDKSIRINGEYIEDYTYKEYARCSAIVTQNQDMIEGNLLVKDLVLMGRYPYKRPFEPYDEEDYDKVEGALVKVGLLTCANQSFSTLSGGERQRVLIAKALCQETELLIMDEPTNHLDLKHQVTLKKLLQDFQGTVILTLHDLNFASQLCDRLLLLKDGEVLVEDNTEHVLRSKSLSEAYELDFHIKTEEGHVNITPIYE